VSKASTLDQRVLETTLETCLADAEGAGIEPPALLVVGEVVRLRAGLDWLGALAEGKALDADPLGVKQQQKAG
jgi:uroporphyrin-III C-methyltransferase